MMKYEVNFVALRLGVRLFLLILILPLTLTLTLVSAQYPTMIPVTEGLLTARPTTEAKRVQEEGMNDELGSMKEETLCDLCASVVEIEQGDRKSLCDLCDSVVGVINEEDETAETQRKQSEDVRWIVLFRSICIGSVFVGALVGIVVIHTKLRAFACLCGMNIPHLTTQNLLKQVDVCPTYSCWGEINPLEVGFVRGRRGILIPR